MTLRISVLILLPLVAFAYYPQKQSFPSFKYPVPRMPSWVPPPPGTPALPPATRVAIPATPANPKPAPTSKVYTVGIMMFHDVEVLDFAGPFEVFAVGGNVHGRFKALTVSDKKVVSALNGLKIVVDHVFGERRFPKIDVLVVPGSNQNATMAALNNPVYVNWIRRTAPEAEYILSVCTGVNFLCRAGLVDGLTITTHHQAFPLAERECPSTAQLVRGRRFTDNGRVLTSAGISAGVDLSLYFTKKIIGRDGAFGVAERMEYDWKDYTYDPSRGPVRSGQTPYWVTN